VGRLRREWDDAGWTVKAVFVVAAAYWLLAVVLVVTILPRVRSAYELGLVLGFYFMPLLYGLVLRAAYVLVHRGPRRPALLSWWVLALGALMAIVVGFAGTASFG
jgi:hypothetical protein